ncbi:MAG: DUF4295 domain-containing protein [Bacteroidales bacterium]
MAKKVVASLQAAGKNYAKVIKMVKSPKTGAYSFKENVMHVEEVQNYLAKK